MARILYLANETQYPLMPELIACDPGQLQTLCVPIQRNQGTL
jgi:hypothetical protein